eukprot:3851352-Ditylum_brightwellii.AAC.1
MGENDRDVFEEGLRLFLDAELGKTIAVLNVRIEAHVISREGQYLRSERPTKDENKKECYTRILLHLNGRCGDACQSSPGEEDIVHTINSNTKRLDRVLKKRAKQLDNSYFDMIKTIIAHTPKQLISPTTQVSSTLKAEDDTSKWILIFAVPLAATSFFSAIVFGYLSRR